MLTFEVTGDKIRRTDNTKCLYAGSREYTECKFTFSPEYEGADKVAVFISQYGTHHQILDNDICYIPTAATAQKCQLNIGVFAVISTTRISTNLTGIMVYEGAYDGADPPEADPDIYAQLFEIYQQAITEIKVNGISMPKDGRTGNLDLTPYSEKEDLDRSVRYLSAKIAEQATQEITQDEIEGIISGVL